MKLTKHQVENDIVTVGCVGEISQSRFKPGSDPLGEIMGDGGYAKRVVLDLAHVNYIDSCGLGWIIACQKRFQNAGGKLVIHSVTPMVRQVFQLLKLDTVLKLCPDRAAALDALQTPAPGPA